MKKKFLALALAAAAITSSIGLTACNMFNTGSNGGNNEQSQNVWGEKYTVEAAYAQAQAMRAQWELIEKAEGWDDGMSYTVVCADD